MSDEYQEHCKDCTRLEHPCYPYTDSDNSKCTEKTIEKEVVSDETVREELSEEIHKLYCKEYLKQTAEEYWTNGDYNLLTEATKDFDRNIADWHINKIAEITEHFIKIVDEMQVYTRCQKPSPNLIDKDILIQKIKGGVK